MVRPLVSLATVELTQVWRAPPNVRFEVDDAESEWAHEKPFDFVHCRTMSASIRDWPRLVKQCFE